MLCHPYGNRVECHAGSKRHVIQPPLTRSTNRSAFLKALRDELRAYFKMKKVKRVTIEIPDPRMGKKKVNLRVAEVIGLLFGVALKMGAKVERRPGRWRARRVKRHRPE
jgi:hypothetical protein